MKLDIVDKTIHEIIHQLVEKVNEILDRLDGQDKTADPGNTGDAAQAAASLDSAPDGGNVGPAADGSGSN